jgi:spheroidene monooxygenase
VIVVMARVVTLHAHRFEGAARLWALWQMGEARLPLMRMPGLDFWKLCGSGSGSGFRPAPDTGVAVILAAWSSEEAAAAGLARAPWTRWAARASERCALALRPISSRGAWSGRAPFEAGSRGAPGPVAALTRASIRLRAAGGFWGRVPRLDDLIGANEEVLFRIGIGELPLIRQGTFTVWPSEAAMARYARTGPHAEAIAAIRGGRVFSEDLYARFEVPAAEGSWRGRPPLGRPAPSLADALRGATSAST